MNRIKYHILYHKILKDFLVIETKKDQFDQAEMNARSVLAKYKSKLNQFSDIKDQIFRNILELSSDDFQNYNIIVVSYCTLNLIKIRKLKVRKNAKHPGESIIAYAHREGCDLIVTGTRAQYTRERMWEESISNYCVWHSWIPVLGKIDQSSPGTSPHDSCPWVER